MPDKPPPILKTGTWAIIIDIDNGDIQAVVTNIKTGNTRMYQQTHADYTDGPIWPGWSESISVCVNDIRDTFDEV